MKKEIDILESAREIKKYCAGRKCENCRFYKDNDYNHCLLGNPPINWEIPEKEILDEVEKEYLWNIIKPFRSKIKYINKRENFEGGKEYINIVTNTCEYISLPYFKKDKMYIGMKLFKKYTVKELFGDE